MARLEKYLEQLQRFGIRPGLERIAALLERAGRPDREYSIVLVGGTNGKGSTCEFLAQMLAASGFRTGLYTSPHLYRWNERIRVFSPASGRAETSGPFPGAISDETLDELFQDAQPHLEAVAAEHGQPTEFETLTFLGLWHFARVGAGVAVVEVGLGGRWDATNVTDPLISVITHVALDHCDRLGSTLEEIARDKMQIARPGHVLVTGEDKPDVLQILHEHCQAIGARLWPVQCPDATNVPEGFAACRREVAEYSMAVQRASPQQFTGFQGKNFLIAATAFSALCRERGYPLPWPQTTFRVPEGRLEVLRSRPTVILDGANNPDGAAHLAHELKQRFLTDGSSRLLLVLGVSSDKDIPAMARELAPLSEHVITTQANHPRAASAELVANEVRACGKPVEMVVPVRAAVERALQKARENDVICVTGSFFVLSEVDRTSMTASNQ